MEHDVDKPTSPTRAEHRSPSQRIPASPASTNAGGIMSRSASSSVVNRGQSREYEQHAPQAWHIGESLFAGMAADRMEGRAAAPYSRRSSRSSRPCHFERCNAFSTSALS
jgi:hypothetical protein